MTELIEVLEIWHPIPRYIGLEASNYGRIRSFKSRRLVDNGVEPRILSQITSKCGYKNIAVYTKGKSRHVRVHKLVALAFLKNPNSYPLVNHKNRDRSDNRVENLEWCTCSHNVKHQYIMRRMEVQNG